MERFTNNLGSKKVDLYFSVYNYTTVYVYNSDEKLIAVFNTNDTCRTSKEFTENLNKFGIKINNSTNTCFHFNN